MSHYTFSKESDLINNDDSSKTNKEKSQSCTLKRNKYTLEELLKDMTSDMQYDEIDWGLSIGEEIIND